MKDDVKELRSLVIKAFTQQLNAEERNRYLSNFMSDEEKTIGKPIFDMNEGEMLEYDRLVLNNEEGNLSDYNCPTCKNKGDIWIIKDNSLCVKECECMPIRRSIANIRKSGLGNLIELYTFANYRCNELWQRQTKSNAMSFIKSFGVGFLICGQSGSGKSHICTAIVNSLMTEYGMKVKFMPWIEESMKIKQAIKDCQEYAHRVDEIKDVDVLYIDDFFKTEKGTKPTSADIRLANEIINYRYNLCRKGTDKRYITVISTELPVRDLNEIDNALTGRIVEMSQPYIIQLIGNEKNFRLFGRSQVKVECVL